MSDWLNRKLAQDLAPVTAPHELAARLGLAPAKRRELSRAVLTVAAGVVLLIGGGYTAVRTAALAKLPRRASTGVEVRLVAANSVPPAAFRFLRCDGGAGMRPQLTAGKATVLLAHAGSTHALYAAPESGCHLCHNL